MCERERERERDRDRDIDRDSREEYFVPGCSDTYGRAVVPQMCAVNDADDDAPQGECKGVLAIRRPWPSMLRTVAGNHERFQEVYFSCYKGLYFTGDGCKRDKVCASVPLLPLVPCKGNMT